MASQDETLITRVTRRLPLPVILAVAGQGFASLTNFGTGMIVGRACGPADLGLYYLGFTVLVFILEMQNALISTPYTVYAPRKEPAEATWYRGSVLVHQGALCLLVCGGFLLASFAGMAGIGPQGMGPVFLALSLVSATFLVRDQARRLCFAHMRMDLALASDVAVALLQLGGLALLWRAGLLTAVTAYAMVGVACGVAAVVYLWSELRTARVSLRRSAEDFQRHWAFGRWIVASALVWSVSMNFYPWFIDYFHGTHEAGIWAAGFTLVSLGNVFIMGVHNFLGPKIAAVYAASGAAALRKFVFEAVLLLALPLAALCGFLYLAGPILLATLFGPEFVDASAVLVLLSLNLSALGLGFVFSRGLFALERADLDFQVNFVPLVLLFAAGIPLVRAYEIRGAAWALCLASGVALCCRVAAFLLAQPREEVVTG